MVIRWVPSQIRLVAYYANLMLVSSFLGLGVGAMLAGRGWKLFRLFAPLFMIDILLLVALASSALPGGSGEWRFQTDPQKTHAYLLLLAVFFFNAVTFVPLGEEIGVQFHRVPPLRAYSWDLGGSLAGTLCFGIFSLLHFSPILGMSLVVSMSLALAVGRFERRQWAWSVPCHVVALGAILLSSQSNAFWSPYYFITVHENFARNASAGPGRPAARTIEDRPVTTLPPADLRTRKDPPIYTVRVNQDFYQLHGTIDVDRYTSGSWKHAMIANLSAQYGLPYQLIGPVDRVLVLGAGGGMDVESALIHGAKRVDAVEIDPVIPALSNRYSAAAPYLRPEVMLHVDDARAFLQKSTDRFDMVVFGFLDSQALFSYGASLRLDGYTYTVEGFRRAFSLVRPGGLMAVSFFTGRDWMAQKLIGMIQAATERVPHVYELGGKLVAIAVKGEAQQVPTQFFRWRLAEVKAAPIDLATDDWPYLYLQQRSVPRDYAVVIGLLLLVSIVAVGALRGPGFGASDAHFLFLGWGFLLLQTKSIADCSLYFGTTWIVTTLVITGVLLMVLIANLTASRFVKAFHPWLYLPLFVSLAVMFVPREILLGEHFVIRLLWTILVVPLPIFFAGLIFSSTFREGGDPSARLGANLIGATVGGFSEYLSMGWGSQALCTIVIGAYVASLISVTRARRSAARVGAS
jgi:hypothetical protein